LCDAKPEFNSTQLPKAANSSWSCKSSSEAFWDASVDLLGLFWAAPGSLPGRFWGLPGVWPGAFLGSFWEALRALSERLESFWEASGSLGKFKVYSLKFKF
jgi:hypothetical protein